MSALEPLCGAPFLPERHHSELPLNCTVLESELPGFATVETESPLVSMAAGVLLQCPSGDLLCHMRNKLGELVHIQSVSVTLILGVYGSVNLQLGPNSSVLITPNPLFVEYIKEWIYVLNEGSQINISYSVNSTSLSSLILIIAQENLVVAVFIFICCVNMILKPESLQGVKALLNGLRTHRSGVIQQDISWSSSYYVAVGNMNSEEVEVQLNLTVTSLLYNTTSAYYNCAVAQGACSLKMFFPNGNSAVLTSPGPEQFLLTTEVTPAMGGGMTILMLLGFHFLNNFQCSREERTSFQFGEMTSERAPLLSQKDDDLSSWGSSYDSVSQGDEDLEDVMAADSLEGKPLKDGEYNNNIRRLCAICFDAPRDCFFLPCGHCVACFACGTRIAELAGTCPICRRNMKKVRRIFTV
ncbi:hypothetical protein RHMOL_Rhmol04G0188800 [Rhododendron molle]|uniref:Uncharacterized protein n=1 Tax=Rhododendron molle TaxID=49168 RepID=A0ACC0P3A8_RHOML|nr:hypothetical protein RHMOL_Rhmol04G0188800 [Rhododendron molle]